MDFKGTATIALCASALAGCQHALNDLESQDLMFERITWHEKTIWMLKSCLMH